MRKELYWLDEKWPGKLAVAPRPRGGDWLQDDVARWKRLSIDAVLSLLTRDEERDMDLLDEGAKVRARGIDFTSFPIPDRQVPKSEANFTEVLELTSRALSNGKNVVVHCRQGIGRSGLLAACLLVKKGMSPGAAMESVSGARGVPIPETSQQKDWIEHYAAALSAMK